MFGFLKSHRMVPAGEATPACSVDPKVLHAASVGGVQTASHLPGRQPVEDAIAQLEDDISIALKSLDGIRNELDLSIAEHVGLSDHIRSEGDGVAAVVTQVEQSTLGLSATVNVLASARNVILSESENVRSSVDDASRIAQEARHELDELARAIASIASVVSLIDRVSKDTRLLALNASIEARRVGTHGRAFGVIADEVKVLAEDTAKATSDITQKIIRLNESASSSIAAIGRVVEVASDLRPSFQAVTKAVADQSGVIDTINTETAHLVRASREASARADGLKEFTGVAVHEAEAIKSASGRLADFMSQFTKRLTTAARQSTALGRRKEPRIAANRAAMVTYGKDTFRCTTVDISGGGIMLNPRPDMDISVGSLLAINMDGVGSVDARVASISGKGLHVAIGDDPEVTARMRQIVEEVAQENAPLVAIAEGGANRVATALEAAIDARRVTIDDVFPKKYDPVAGTEPRQFTVPVLPVYEEILQPIVADLMGHGGMIYAVANDRNGYCPVHAPQFSQPQRRGDSAFNATYSRNRVLHLDDDTLGIARSALPHLIQRYRRVTGKETLTVKDVSVPIFVRGRHWGVFRTGWPL
jgi:methyl-accepting chemotaxis protein